MRGGRPSKANQAGHTPAAAAAAAAAGKAASAVDIVGGRGRGGSLAGPAAAAAAGGVVPDSSAVGRGSVVAGVGRGMVKQEAGDVNGFPGMSHQRHHLASPASRAAADAASISAGAGADAGKRGERAALGGQGSSAKAEVVDGPSSPSRPSVPVFTPAGGDTSQSKESAFHASSAAAAAAASGATGGRNALVVSRDRARLDAAVAAAGVLELCPGVQLRMLPDYDDIAPSLGLPGYADVYLDERALNPSLGPGELASVVLAGVIQKEKERREWEVKQRVGKELERLEGERMERERLERERLERLEQERKERERRERERRERLRREQERKERERKERERKERERKERERIERERKEAERRERERKERERKERERKERERKEKERKEREERERLALGLPVQGSHGDTQGRASAALGGAGFAAGMQQQQQQQQAGMLVQKQGRPSLDAVLAAAVAAGSSTGGTAGAGAADAAAAAGGAAMQQFSLGAPGSATPFPQQPTPPSALTPPPLSALSAPPPSKPGEAGGPVTGIVQGKRGVVGGGRKVLSKMEQEAALLKEMEKTAKAWSSMVRKDLLKHHRLFVMTHKKQSLDCKRTAELCQREVRARVTRSVKAAKGAPLRMKRLARDMVLFWRRYDREQTELRKREEKEALEARRREEELREARRQQQRLNFLLTQTELYSHFMHSKVAPGGGAAGGAGAKARAAATAAGGGAAAGAAAGAGGSGAGGGGEGLSAEEVEENERMAEEARLAAVQAASEQQSRTNLFDSESRRLRGEGGEGEGEGEGEEEDLGAGREGEEGMAADMDLLNPSTMPEASTVAQPSIFRGRLKEYQLKGLQWLVNLYEQGLNGILADEMGLGKTIQAMTFLAHLAEEKGIWGPFLVVAPASVLSNWADELARFLPEFKVLPYWGGLPERTVLRKNIHPKKLYRKDAAFHVMVTSYQLLVADDKYLRRVKWQYLVLDEAQAIKSAGSIRWRTLLSFSCRNRLLLTGTPIQNSMAELWALLHFIMPTLFDSHEQFSEWFSKGIEGHAEHGGLLNEHQLSRLHAILKPFMLRRVKKDVETEMSGKKELVVPCELRARQQALYRAVKNKISIADLFDSVGGQINEKKVLHLMNLVIQLRKVCNHPELFERNEAAAYFYFATISPPLQPPPFGELDWVPYSGRHNPITYTVPKLLYPPSDVSFLARATAFERAVAGELMRQAGCAQVFMGEGSTDWLDDWEEDWAVGKRRDGEEEKEEAAEEEEAERGRQEEGMEERLLAVHRLLCVKPRGQGAVLRRREHWLKKVEERRFSDKEERGVRKEKQEGERVPREVVTQVGEEGVGGRVGERGEGGERVEGRSGEDVERSNEGRQEGVDVKKEEEDVIMEEMRGGEGKESDKERDRERDKDKGGGEVKEKEVDGEKDGGEEAMEVDGEKESGDKNGEVKEEKVEEKEGDREDAEAGEREKDAGKMTSGGTEDDVRRREVEEDVETAEVKEEAEGREGEEERRGGVKEGGVKEEEDEGRHSGDRPECVENKKDVSLDRRNKEHSSKSSSRQSNPERTNNDREQTNNLKSADSHQNNTADNNGKSSSDSGGGGCGSDGSSDNQVPLLTGWPKDPPFLLPSPLISSFPDRLYNATSLIRATRTFMPAVRAPPIDFLCHDRSFAYQQQQQLYPPWALRLLLGFTRVNEYSGPFLPADPAARLSVRPPASSPVLGVMGEEQGGLEVVGGGTGEADASAGGDGGGGLRGGMELQLPRPLLGAQFDVEGSSPPIQIFDFSKMLTDSGKLHQLDVLLRRLRAEGHRVLLFAQMTKMLNILEDYMNYRKYKYLRLDGSSTIVDRREMVKDFQHKSEIFVFLLSTRAGGLGINLTAADTVIFYESDWNPTMDLQAMDRAHRLGQTREVTVYRMICGGTVEEKIVKRANQKNTVQQLVMTGQGGAAGGGLVAGGGGTGGGDVFEAEEVVSLLLDDAELEAQLKAQQEQAAAKQHSHAEEMVSLLLDGAELEAQLKAQQEQAAAKQHSAEEVVSLLLDDAELEAQLKAQQEQAAAKQHSVEEVVSLLLDDAELEAQLKAQQEQAAAKQHSDRRRRRGSKKIRLDAEGGESRHNRIGGGGDRRRRRGSKKIRLDAEGGEAVEEEEGARGGEESGGAGRRDGGAGASENVSGGDVVGGGEGAGAGSHKGSDMLAGAEGGLSEAEERNGWGSREAVFLEGTAAKRRRGPTPQRRRLSAMGWVNDGQGGEDGGGGGGGGGGEGGRSRGSGVGEDERSGGGEVQWGDGGGSVQEGGEERSQVRLKALRVRLNMRRGRGEVSGGGGGGGAEGDGAGD
ncbi:unnamed protein product [Closterium sp. NIES-64]|nr:unnamed protein product [Closterium sp. NIES-64]